MEYTASIDENSIDFKRGDAILSLNLCKTGEIQVACDCHFQFDDIQFENNPTIEEIEFVDLSKIEWIVKERKPYVFCTSLTDVERIRELGLYYIHNRPHKDAEKKLFAYTSWVGKYMMKKYVGI